MSEIEREGGREGEREECKGGRGETERKRGWRGMNVVLRDNAERDASCYQFLESWHWPLWLCSPHK